MTFSNEQELYRHLIKMERHLQEHEAGPYDKSGITPYHELREMTSYLVGFFGKEVRGMIERQMKM